MKRTYSKTIRGFDIYRNGNFIGFISGQNKSTRIKAVRSLITSTHMGQWTKTEKGFEYSTTIGVYIEFQKFFRIIELRDFNKGVK